jgi:hypothetical protein
MVDAVVDGVLVDGATGAARGAEMAEELAAGGGFVAAPPELDVMGALTVAVVAPVVLVEAAEDDWIVFVETGPTAGTGVTGNVDFSATMGGLYVVAFEGG